MRTITRTRAQPNSAQLSPNSNSTPVNTPANYSTADENCKCSVFIDNLPVNITPPQVEEELEKFGAVKPCGVQVRSRPGGRPCFGFVEFVEAASVQTALQSSPILIRGCKVSVRENEKQTSKAPRKSTPFSFSGSNYNIAKGTGQCSVFVSNLAANITPSQLEEEMKKFGAIKPSGVQVRNRPGAQACYGFVEFKEAVSAQAAIQASPILINDRRVYIRAKQK